MEPAVAVVLAECFSRPYTTGGFEDSRLWRGFKPSEKPTGLKRPHSRRNPWQPQAANLIQSIKKLAVQNGLRVLNSKSLTLGLMQIAHDVIL